jgi:hypothetical protein
MCVEQELSAPQSRRIRKNPAADTI